MFIVQILGVDSYDTINNIQIMNDRYYSYTIIIKILNYTKLLQVQFI